MKTTKQVAAALGVQPVTIRARALRYDIGTIYGRDRLFTDEDIEALRKHIRGEPGRPPVNDDSGSGKTFPPDVVDRIEAALPELAELIKAYREAGPERGRALERQIAQNIPPGRGLEIFPIPSEWWAICRMAGWGAPYEFRKREQSP
jgi:hypothetical protein